MTNITDTARPVALHLAAQTGDAAKSAWMGALYGAWMADNAHLITEDNADEAIEAFFAYCRNAAATYDAA